MVFSKKFKKLAGKVGVDLKKETKRATKKFGGGSGSTSFTQPKDAPKLAAKPRDAKKEFDDTIKKIIPSGKGILSKLGKFKDDITGETKLAEMKAKGEVTTIQPAFVPGPQLAVGAIRAATSKSAVKTVSKVGTKGLSKAKGVVGKIASNSKTQKGTVNMLKIIGLSATATSLAVGVIGSYPFAGFIKEEALQTLGLAVTAAMINDDLEGAEIALQAERELLEPDLWDQIVAKVPYANVVSQLNNFYEAAKIKLVIDEQVLADRKIQIETGESEDEKWKRVRQQEADQDKEVITFYNDERKKLVTWENEARALAKQSTRRADIKARNEDAAFWAKQRANQRKLEAADRQAVTRFWQAYRKRAQKVSEDNRPSNLNFGLI